MQIYGASQLHGAQSISGPHTARTAYTEAPARSSAIGDQLDISAAGSLAAQMSEIPDIRQDRVAALKAAIQSGTYETEHNLSGALDRLLDEIG